MRSVPARRTSPLRLPLVAALLLAGSPSAAQDARPGGLQPGPHHVVVNDVRLWYRVAGEAPADVPPVVFLHGGPGQGSAHFDALAGPHLEPSLRMVYLDQRGSGHSERPWTDAYSIDLLTEDVEGLRRHLGVPRIALIGHSFGGLLALEYAARYPEHVSHLVVAAGGWDFALQCPFRLDRLAELRPEAYARITEGLTEEEVRRDACALEFRAFESAEERDAYNTELMFPDPSIETKIDSVNAAHGIRNTGELGRALFRGGLLDQGFDAFERLTMPVLILAGHHDGAARPAGLRILAERLPNARFVEYERSGHFVYLDEPARFAQDVAAFVRE